MKTKIIFFLLVALFKPFAHLAQIQTITGEENKILKRPFAQFLVEQEGSFYTIGVDKSAFDNNYQNRKLFLYKFNSQSYSLQEEYIIEPLIFLGNKTVFEVAYSNAKGFHLLFRCYDKKAGIKYLLHQKLSKDGKVSAPRVLADMKDVKGKRSKFIIHTTEKNEALLIYEEVIEAGAMVRLPKLTMCDENFNILWVTTASTPFPEKVFVPTQIEVSKRGELFILGFAKKAEENTRKASVTSEYGVIRIVGNEGSNSFLLQTMRKIIHSASIKPDFKGTLLLTGFYSNSTDELAGGSFFCTLNQTTLDVESQKAEEFSKDIMKEFSSEGKSPFEVGLSKLLAGGYGTHEGLSGFNYQDFLPQADGGVIIVAEKEYEKPAGDKVYHCTDEILVASFDGDGSLSWLSVVPKKQALSGLFQSYLLHHGTDGLYFIFNDHPDNLEIRNTNGEIKTQGARVSDSNAIIAAHVSKTGKVSFQRLGELESNNRYIPTYYGISANKENLLTLTVWRMGTRYSFTQYKFP